jgi:hypothetical protein
MLEYMSFSLFEHIQRLKLNRLNSGFLLKRKQNYEICLFELNTYSFSFKEKRGIGRIIRQIYGFILLFTLFGVGMLFVDLA